MHVYYKELLHLGFFSTFTISCHTTVILQLYLFSKLDVRSSRFKTISFDFIFAYPRVYKTQRLAYGNLLGGLKGNRIQRKLLCPLYTHPIGYLCFEILFVHRPVALDPTGARKIHIHLLQQDAPEGWREKVLITFEPNLSLRHIWEVKPRVCLNHHLTLALTERVRTSGYPYCLAIHPQTSSEAVILCHNCVDTGSKYVRKTNINFPRPRNNLNRVDGSVFSWSLCLFSILLAADCLISEVVSSRDNFFCILLFCASLALLHSILTFFDHIKTEGKYNTVNLNMKCLGYSIGIPVLCFGYGMLSPQACVLLSWPPVCGTIWERGFKKQNFAERNRSPEACL